MDISRHGDVAALITYNRATHWLEGFGSCSKDAASSKQALQRFMGPQCEPQLIYTDNSEEFGKACKDLNWCHDTSRPHLTDTNGVAE